MRDEEESEEEEEHRTLNELNAKLLGGGTGELRNSGLFLVLREALLISEDALRRKKMEVEETGEMRTSWYGSFKKILFFY